MSNANWKKATISFVLSMFTSRRSLHRFSPCIKHSWKYWSIVASTSSKGVCPFIGRISILINVRLVFDFSSMFWWVPIRSKKISILMCSMIFARGKHIGRYFLQSRLFSFHEKDTESQRIVIENLSKYLLRKSYLTNILIGKRQERMRVEWTRRFRWFETMFWFFVDLQSTSSPIGRTDQSSDQRMLSCHTRCSSQSSFHRMQSFHRETPRKMRWSCSPIDLRL